MKGEASVTVDEMTLDLVFDNDALVTAEDASGKSLIDLVAEIYGAATARQAPRLGTQRALLFAATRQNHPELSLSECGDLIMDHGQKLTAPLAKALLDAMPKAKPKGEAKAPATKPRRPARKKVGTGTARKPTGAKPVKAPKRSGALRPES